MFYCPDETIFYIIIICLKLSTFCYLMTYNKTCCCCIARGLHSSCKYVLTPLSSELHFLHNFLSGIYDWIFSSNFPMFPVKMTLKIGFFTISQFFTAQDKQRMLFRILNNAKLLVNSLVNSLFLSFFFSLLRCHFSRN